MVKHSRQCNTRSYGAILTAYQNCHLQVSTLHALMLYSCNNDIVTLLGGHASKVQLSVTGNSLYLNSLVKRNVA